MINGNPATFIDTVYSGQEIFFLYDGNKYMYQGYTVNDVCHMEIQQHIPWVSELVWHAQNSSMQECLEEFEKAPIFNGKSFWDVESEIEWVDE